jgi:hypothetical protein
MTGGMQPEIRFSFRMVCTPYDLVSLTDKFSASYLFCLSDGHTTGCLFF